MDDAWAATSPQGTTGAYQQFEQGTIYSSSYGTYATVGKIDQEHNIRGGTSGYGFPKGDMIEQNGRLSQEFEGGTISMCGGADRSKQQLCVDSVQSKFEAGQKPVIHIVYGNATKVSIEVSTSPQANPANRFEYKVLDYWPMAGDSGERYYEVPDTLLWSNSRDGQVQKIYYKVTTKRGDDSPIAYFPSNNAFGEEATFEKVIKTPEYLNPLERDPLYTYKGGLDYYDGHTGADIKATEGANIRNVRKGTVERAGVFFYDGCYQVPERNNMDNSVVGVKTADGEVIRYRHMSISSIERLIRNGVIKDVDIGQNADVGDVDDLGCSTPGFDHLHVEVQVNKVYKEPKQYILF